MKTNPILSITGGVAEIVFTPEVPGKPPTVDHQLLDRLEAQLRELADREGELSLLLLKSAVPKYFVVGANLEALKLVDKDSISRWIRRGHEVFGLLEELPVPSAAVVTGFALGGGLELALSCDYILAADTARFGLPEAGLGFIPGWGGSRRLPERIGAARAKELMYTGRVVDAAEAFRLGLVNFVGSAGELDAHVAEMASSMEANSRLSLRLVKKIVNSQITENRRLSQLAEETASGVLLSSGDTVRRLADFFAKREKK